MAINLEVLLQQLCSVCHKYLSVGSIKVYTNRQVKCGRCSKDDDFGVESKLFLTVMEGTKFPCINSLEGCAEELSIAEMKLHEEKCKGNLYECLICNNYEGTAWELNGHCERAHKKETLKGTNFFIDLEKGSYKRCYFYRKERIFLFVLFCYEQDLNKIRLNSYVVGKKFNGDNMVQEWTFWSLENEEIFKTKNKECSKFKSGLGEGFDVDISTLKFYKDVVFCKFEVIGRSASVLSIEKDPPSFSSELCLVNPNPDHFEVLCLFTDISKAPYKNLKFSEYPQVYWFYGIPWKFSIFSIKDNVKKNGRHLETFILWPKTPNHESQTEYRLCSACSEPISDKFLLEVSGRTWHARCLRCCVCQLQLDRQPSCFIRDRAIYCKADYAKSFGAKCSICMRGISSSDWVRKARDHVYHLACFACAACHRQLSTGEEFALHEDRVLCKAHYLETLDGGTTSSDDGCDADGYHKNKAKRVRTTFTEEQLQVLQANFQLDSNPDGQDLERIAQITGLSKRVTQVWFQNSRARQKKHMHTGKVKSQLHNGSREENGFGRHINLHLTYSFQQQNKNSIFSQPESSLDELSQDSTLHCMQSEV